jgi:multidrug resistance efflux pump
MSDATAPKAKVAKADSPNPPTPAEMPAPAPRDTAGGRKVAGKIFSVVIVFAAIVLALYVWKIIERHPRTDDATARANVVGIVPRVRGQI